MGEALHLRIPATPPAPRDVIAAPRECHSGTAREVLARPDQYREDQVRDASLWLRDNGDWMDRSRALEMLKALDRQEWLKSAEAIEEAERVADLRELRIACGIILIFALCLAVFDEAWAQHLTAGLR
jgi:hypothetical protein